MFAESPLQVRSFCWSEGFVDLQEVPHWDLLRASSKHGATNGAEV